MHEVSCIWLGPSGADVKYERNMFWANKKMTLVSWLYKVITLYYNIFLIKAKRDNSWKTRAAKKLPEMDTLVLEVIRKKSRTCDGILPQEPNSDQVSLKKLVSTTSEDCKDIMSLLQTQKWLLPITRRNVLFVFMFITYE